MRRWLTTIFQRKPAQAVQAESMRLGNLDANHPYAVFTEDRRGDVISGMCFHATHQLRTPLRILQRNGQILPLGTDFPNDFEQWMGIWVPRTKTFRDLGLDIDEIPPSKVASDIGPVNSIEYLPFLVAIREIVEDQSLIIADRKIGIETVCRHPKFQKFAKLHGGSDEIYCYLYPTILSLIPDLTASIRQELKTLGICTVAGLRQSSDKMLAGVKGLGPAKIHAIRAFCDAYKGDIDSEHRTELE